MKLGKNYEKILEKLWENVKSALHKFKKKHFDGNIVKVILEELTKNCTEISNNLIEKFQRNPEEILEIFGVLLKIWPGELQSLIWPSAVE